MRTYQRTTKTPTAGDIRQLAGLLEGEGCFRKNGDCRSVSIFIGMTDRDVVKWAAQYLGASIRERSRPAPRQTMYEAVVGGANAAGWMMMLYPFMGARRRATIRVLLNEWRQPLMKYHRSGKVEPDPAGYRATAWTDARHRIAGCL